MLCSFITQQLTNLRSLIRKKKTQTGFSTEEKIAVSVIGLFHLVGAGLLLFSKGGLYQVALDLVPINLIFTFLVAVKYQTEFSLRFILTLVWIYCIGLAAEIVGVNYGWLFGEYTYGEVLGIAIFNTPLIIGLNWVLVTYCTGSFIELFRIPKILKCFASVVFLVSFDYFLEPVAIKNGFWTWTNGGVPLQNYIGWAIVSSILMTLFFYTDFPKKNKVASTIIFIQFAFFLVQNLF